MISDDVDPSHASVVGEIDSETPSDFPIGPEWRAIFNSSIPNLMEVAQRAHDEWNRRIEACMRAKGFDFSMGSIEVAEPDYRVLSNPLRRDTLDLGYHLPPQPPFAGATAELSPEMELALDGGDSGPPVGGSKPGSEESAVPCISSPEIKELTSARNQVDEAWASILISLQDALQSESLLETLEALTADWSTCMRGAGYEYGSQESARSAFATQSEISDLELQVRAFDLECDVRVGLTRTRSELERSMFERWRSDNAVVIAEFSTQVAEFSDLLLAMEAEEPFGDG